MMFGGVSSTVSHRPLLFARSGVRCCSSQFLAPRRRRRRSTARAVVLAIGRTNCAVEAAMGLARQVVNRVTLSYGQDRAPRQVESWIDHPSEKARKGRAPSFFFDPEV